EVRF
ncbi:MAG: TonB-dependent receptor, partial [Porphyrobacter sp. HL-46]